MQVDLDKIDLVNLVASTAPYYSLFTNPLVTKFGKYFGGQEDRWSWDKHMLKELTEQELYDLYQLCKNSWK